MITKKDILDDSHKLLREKSEDVKLPLSEKDAKLLDDMMEYLIMSQDAEKAKEYDLNPGVGMAAPQVGVLKKMFVVYTTDENGNLHQYALVNPKIISTSVTKAYLEGGEGCLSVPVSHEGYVKRYNKVKIKAFDHISNKDVLLSLKGYVAIVVQHEYDHLFGVLYYDRINKNDPFGIKDGEIAI